ncbi:uroporphyrinogen-III C-methyltransferase [Microvirga brassicacearum]|uniref:uroporphyrinogen-III C-methyltransferase n=1 Tax=Microvirga brassicacearum TaxID=2580413 RepID=A0A5N3P6Q8_9HYPH|nr:uroporphyrinogen-III C-methyltransferase [Microvirga brassicacearum]KAB0265406.1 uroporphyrinogen-III C-methyltransferase [Microvirga brassicacearum]
MTHLSPSFEPGTVWLVGAGPGDPGLLTLHGANALAAADVIVHDALVDSRILALARPDAVLENAGKRGGRASVAQTDITDRLIALAKAGRRVLRLKGGDPFIFGRGGEEALALTEAGIFFRIIPGVSSGLASLAIHGIPATTRDTNQAVILATGHCAEGHRTDWAALARAGVPIVLYMAVTNVVSIVAELIEGGLDAATPVLIVCAATTADEAIVEARLGELPRLSGEGALRSPAILVIGAIAAFRSQIQSHLLDLRSEVAA